MSKGYSKKLMEKFGGSWAEIKEDMIPKIRTKTRGEIGRQFRKDLQLSTLRYLYNKHAGNSTISDTDLRNAMKASWTTIYKLSKELKEFEVSRIKHDGEYWIVIDHKKEGA